MQTFTATSYSMGNAIDRVTFQASTPEAAATSSALRGLGAHGAGEGGRRIRVIGIRRHDKKVAR